MAKVTLISVDLAKDVFQVAGFTTHLNMEFNRKLKRRDLADFMARQPACEVVMEACYSSHYWARVFISYGHTVRLLPAQHVTPFVRGNKSDHNDAVAIAEASMVQLGTKCSSLTESVETGLYASRNPSGGQGAVAQLTNPSIFLQKTEIF
jgi:transposase